MLPTTTQSQASKELATTSWGTENVSSKDLVIPKISLAQASSNVAKEGQARAGELIHSQTKQLLAAKGEKFAVLPILIIAQWVITTPKPSGGGYPDFIRNEPLTPENDSSEWKIEDFENGQPVVRNKKLTFLVLPVSDIAGFPYFIDFTGTNKNGGKALSTIMQENRFKGRPAAARVVELSTILRQYKNNSWFIVNATPGRDASEEELVRCRKWYDVFSRERMTAAESSEDNGID
jgi:hypothetical protein